MMLRPLSVALAVLFSLLTPFAAQGAYDQQEYKAAEVIWYPVSHAEFRGLFHRHSEGFTVRFFDMLGEDIAREFHDPSGAVYLEEYTFGTHNFGTIDYVADNLFCYTYAMEKDLPSCWRMYQSEEGFRVVSDDSLITDYFEIEPGNAFAEQWGEGWKDSFH